MEITSETRAPEEAIPPRLMPPGLLLAGIGRAFQRAGESTENAHGQAPELVVVARGS